LRLKPGVTEIQVIEASDLPLALDTKEVEKLNCPNVFVTVVVDRKTHELATYEHRKSGTAPVWNAKFVSDTNDPERDTLVITVHAVRDWLSTKHRPPSQFVGRARLSAMIPSALAAFRVCAMC
jgi:hypothetical protein